MWSTAVSNGAPLPSLFLVCLVKNQLKPDFHAPRLIHWYVREAFALEALGEKLASHRILKMLDTQQAMDGIISRLWERPFRHTANSLAREGFDQD